MELMKEKRFGYGCMRLPLLNKEDQTSFDYELIYKLFDTYLEKGLTYFDTAYTYHGYHAEEAVLLPLDNHVLPDLHVLHGNIRAQLHVHAALKRSLDDAAKLSMPTGTVAAGEWHSFGSGHGRILSRTAFS